MEVRWEEGDEEVEGKDPNKWVRLAEGMRVNGGRPAMMEVRWEEGDEEVGGEGWRLKKKEGAAGVGIIRFLF